jgi:hypothetical protein
MTVKKLGISAALTTTGTDQYIIYSKMCSSEVDTEISVIKKLIDKKLFLVI